MFHIEQSYEDRSRARVRSNPNPVRASFAHILKGETMSKNAATDLKKVSRREIRKGGTMARILGKRAHKPVPSWPHPPIVMCVPWEARKTLKDSKGNVLFESDGKTAREIDVWTMIPVSEYLAAIETECRKVSIAMKSAPMADVEEAVAEIWINAMEYLTETAVPMAMWKELQTSLAAKAEGARGANIVPDVDQHPALI